ncbi:MAG: hypothetical protein SWE60_14960 [Thermodesulfobacteriota bacterium]|nr:hypothetical protein [Thermodesulfobacteriota bacterium]
MEKRDQSRVLLTEEMFSRLVVHTSKGTVSEFAREKGVPYGLIYNLAHRRIKSISARDYKRIFGEKPPDRQIDRVDGTYFRGMVRLWQFLHRHAKKKDLYDDFYPGKKIRRADSRIFSGRVRTIEKRLEKMMEKRFFDQGLERPDIKSWIADLDQSEHQERVPYEAAKSALQYLRQVMKIRPSRVLKQRIGRYESGALKTISKERYRRILHLKEKVERTSLSGSKGSMEKLLDEISGRREQMTLFSEVKDELDFLRAHGVKGTKRYLGRSVSHYEKSKLRRIATWRAQKIKADCDELIDKMTEMKVASLPKPVIPRKMAELISVLKSSLVAKLIRDENTVYERGILLAPFHDKEKYRKESYGVTPMDQAPSALGMSKKAFDVMVATHADVFRKIARHDRRWYLSNLYIKALNKEEEFQILKAKYALLAQRGRPSYQSEEEEGEEPSSNDKASHKIASTLYSPQRRSTGYGLICPGLSHGVGAHAGTLKGLSLLQA